MKATTPDPVQAQLLDWVRKVLDALLRSLPDPAPEGLPDCCAEARGCFVTLSNRGRLRGCCGRLNPEAPLGETLAECARAAARADHRFPPVERSEWPELEIELSLLGPLVPLEAGTPEALLRSLKPHVDGVWMCCGFQRATFLPQVWEQLPDPEAFLIQLSRKAGGPDDLWRRPETRFHTYRVEAFGGRAQAPFHG